MIRAALALHEATGQGAYLEQAVAWQHVLDRHYADPAAGYFLTADDALGLIVRPNATTDDATPNPTSVTAQNLIRLATLTGEDKWREAADRLFDRVLPLAATVLVSHTALLNALDLRLGAAEIVVTGSGAQAQALTRQALRIPALERIIVRAADAGALPPGHPAREKISAAPEGAAFVCVGERCSLPVTDPAAIAQTIADMRAPARI
jgi:uncharacterized protein YyaL (SSP411 family)